MKTTPFIYLGLAIVLSACGATFVNQSLQNGEENAVDYLASIENHALAFEDFSAKSIFSDAVTDEVWGLEKDDCKDFKSTAEISAEGDKAIQLEWNLANGTCDWAGMGFGWNGWQGKPLGDIMFSSALQLKIRTISGTNNTIPTMVFLIEDYGNTQVAVGLSSAFLERPYLDEEWQNITVPLYLFNFDKAEADAFNVKQLLIEVQGKGSVLIDELELIPYNSDAAVIADIYKPVVREASNSPFKDFDANIIYNGDIGGVWGMEKTLCKTVSPSTEKPLTDNSIELQWSNETKGCDWIGMGFGWDNYNPKDLSSVLEDAAIEMNVRAPKGKTLYSIPIVALIEDYNSKQCATLFKSKNYSSPPITDEWQKVYLPLSDFDYEKIGVDMSNVKQLIFQLLGSGHLFIDDIKLVPYNAPEEMPKVVYKLKDQLPLTIYDDAFLNNNAWGLVKNDCRNFKVSERNDNQYLDLNWKCNNEDCSFIWFGASWNKWEPVSFEKLNGKESIRFKVLNGVIPTFSVGFENYNYQKALVVMDDKYIVPGDSEWTVIEIPLTDIFTDADFNRANVKQLIFTFQGEGSLQMDAITIQ